jgi:hypothetical protein
MGKTSRRREGREPRAQRVTPHPYFDCEFRPIQLSADLLAEDVVQAMQSLVTDDEVLADWQLGRKGTHIASRFVSAGGQEDTLCSPDPLDDDYVSLVKAHINRAFLVIKSEMGAGAWDAMMQAGVRAPVPVRAPITPLAPPIDLTGDAGGAEVPVAVNDAVRVLGRAGHVGRVLRLHANFQATGHDNTWLLLQNEPPTRAQLDEPWCSIAVRSGGSVLVPMARVVRSEREA